MQAADARAPAELIEGIALRRDRADFADLFRRFAPQIKRYLLARGAGGSEAEELTQEVMLTIWRRAESFDPSRATASTWIFAIARNRWIDTLRQRRPPIDPDSDLGSRPITWDVGPLSAAEVDSALESGRARAESLRQAGLLWGAVLVLRGRTAVVGTTADRIAA